MKGSSEEGLFSATPLPTRTPVRKGVTHARCGSPIYPATDLSRESQSHKQFSDGYFLTKELIDWF